MWSVQFVQICVLTVLAVLMWFVYCWMPVVVDDFDCNGNIVPVNIDDFMSW